MQHPVSYWLQQGSSIQVTIPIQYLPAFLRQQLRKRTPWSAIYWLINGAILAWIIREALITSLPWWEIGLGLGQGFWLFFVLVPVHELIHALAYKVVGASQIRFQVEWRRLLAYTTANEYVATYTEFIGVALSPFVVINTSLLVGWWLMPTGVHWPLLGALLLHTGGCFGDFGLLSFFYQHPHWLTFDDVPKQTINFIKPI